MAEQETGDPCQDHVEQTADAPVAETTDSQSGSSPAEAFWSDLRRLANSVYTNNPFYAISAGLVLYGLHLGSTTDADTYNPWVLFLLLTGYTSLMAATGVLVVRLGSVWEDARSILLIVVLQLLWSSISYDQILLSDRAAGRGLLAASMLFSVLVTEAVMRDLSIRLGAWYRVAYYGLIALFFAYPLVTVELVSRRLWDVIPWALLGFSPAAGIVSLLLAPAIRRGAGYVKDSGTPWPWPWFPLSLFVALGLAVVGRCYWLSISFGPAKEMDTVFGPYFLVPFFAAIAYLILELGVATGSRSIQRAALASPFVLLLLSFPGSAGSEVYADFVRAIVGAIGSPSLWTLGFGIAFLVFAWSRRIPHALDALTLLCLGGAFIGPETIGWETLTAPNLIPVALAAGVQTALAVRSRFSARCVAAGGLLLAALSIAGANTWIASGAYVVPIHLFLATLLLVGLYCDDDWARLIQYAGAIGLTGVAGAIVLHPRGDGVSLLPLALYCAATASTCFAYWRAASDGFFAFAGSVQLLVASVPLIREASVQLRNRTLPRGLGIVVVGILVFGVAVAISAAKAGFRPWRRGERFGTTESTHTNEGAVEPPGA